MKTLNEGELYNNVRDFLKTKGIELKDGSYTQRVQQGCRLLSEAINVSQRGLRRARQEARTKLEQMRQVIHEKTAPKAPATGAAARKREAGAKPRTSRRQKSGRKPQGSAPAGKKRGA